MELFTSTETIVTSDGNSDMFSIIILLIEEILRGKKCCKFLINKRSRINLLHSFYEFSLHK